ncbi:serine hydrolase [Actinacidiphila oryziradicis]|uniref:D-alanyl-D-alanine carboxypeptidase family protein n=1 Tax=Actinacidiphila oryziradicis TaxID=2571141 RepID=UPI0023F2FF15|nr:serine hydrolase [Actinacidiphila oryziradicis]MCW2872275.1 D-alanyl-D-alanine carboxypeptidase [Actinacidiphila oryziradicis]
MEHSLRHGLTRIHRFSAAAVASSAVLIATAAAAPAQAASAPAVTAKGAIVFDSTALSGKGKTLYGKTADTKRQMASTTKLMTAVVVLGEKNLNLTKKVTVKQAYRDYVAKNKASTADLKTGDKLTVGQLLYAMLLPSGCDAAMALADTYGTGTTIAARTKSFIKQMNAKAVSLKMTNTTYDSFDGISTSSKNLSTPRDMAKLAVKGMSYTTLRTVVKAKSSVQKATASNGHTRTYTWTNTNTLLGSYSGAVGIKTGTGSVAGPCMIFAATRSGRTIIVVLLHSSSVSTRFKEAAKLADWAFGTSTSSSLKLRTLPSGMRQD